MWWVKKESNPDPIAYELPADAKLGRCRKRSPTLQGFPAVWSVDWCGDHKLDENKV